MAGTNIFSKRDGSFQKCPDCSSSGTLRSSHSRNIFEAAVKRITFFKIYRCKNCGWRGYKSNLSITAESLKTLAIYIFIALICGIAVRFILKKFM